MSPEAGGEYVKSLDSKIETFARCPHPIHPIVASVAAMYGADVAPDRSPRSLVHQIEASPVPLKVLEAVRELREYLDGVEATFMREARDAGASITHIAEALGTTRQTVHNRLKQLAGGQPALEDAVVIPDLEPEPDA